jgi:hypothetical protein
MADRLSQMRLNPTGDWTIADVEAVCRQHGASCTPPTGGSHYKISHPSRLEKLTVPYRKPIKPVYIRKLVVFLARAGGDDANH